MGGGTHKASVKLGGKSGSKSADKSGGKSKASHPKDSVKHKNASSKESKPASALLSIKQALFGSGESKKSASGKKESTKGHTKAAPSKSESHHAIKDAKEAKKTKESSKETASGKKSAETESHHAAAPSKGAVAQPPKELYKTKKAPSGRGAGSRGVVSVRASLLAAGESMCREVACEGLATSGGYCRLHYIKNWKKIKRKEVILKEGKLNQYIEELVVKYPDKYIEAIRQDLANDKDFAIVIHDLDLDESLDDFDAEGEGSDNIIDSIKRDFDDDGDTGF